MSNDPSNPWQPPPGPPPPPAGPLPPPGFPPTGYAYPYGYAPAPPSNDKAGWALACGIAGLTACPPAGIGGWVLGRQAMNECRATGQGGYGMAQVGFVLGIIGTVILGLMVLGFLFFIVVFSVAHSGGV